MINVTHPDSVNHKMSTHALTIQVKMNPQAVMMRLFCVCVTLCLRAWFWSCLSPCELASFALTMMWLPPLSQGAAGQNRWPCEQSHSAGSFPRTLCSIRGARASGLGVPWRLGSRALLSRWCHLTFSTCLSLCPFLPPNFVSSLKPHSLLLASASLSDHYICLSG